MTISSQFTFFDLLDIKVVVADGAMGTMLYQHGVFVNTCYDELNLTRPDLISKIHNEYVQAGADFIETNTFGANPVKLAQFGLAEKTEQINEKAVEIAKKSGWNKRPCSRCDRTFDKPIVKQKNLTAGFC